MKEFGAHFLKQGDLAYAFIRSEDGMTELYEPELEEIDEELKKHFVNAAPRWYLMEMIRDRKPDVRGFLIEVEKFKKAWQNGEIE